MEVIVRASGSTAHHCHGDVLLPMVMDVYSRKIVGWQVHRRESSELAADMMTDICIREDIKCGEVTLFR